MASSKKEEPSFEEALSALDSLVKQLEQGDAPLADLVKSYEKGQSLLRICRERLQDAELRVKIINEDGTESASVDKPTA
ncbi:MAG: exodeoxyribonuclease VII small subunit [Opitutales bacterium]